jgi:hypothetical protein
MWPVITSFKSIKDKFMEKIITGQVMKDKVLPKDHKNAGVLNQLRTTIRVTSQPNISSINNRFKKKGL